MIVADYVGVPAVLEQTAEECVELAQACLKMARKLRNENPTPANMDDILKALNTEMADVMVCMNAIVEAGVTSYEAIDSEYMIKENRWERRINDKESK